jgi:predicted nuclease of predicted toxin-antitoxin system
VKLWIDAQLPQALARWLVGHFDVEADTLDALGLRHAHDTQIFAALRTQGSVIVSKDEDFVDLVTRLGPPPQVLWVTCGNVTNRALRAVFGGSLAAALDLIRAGEPIVEITDRQPPGV